MNRQSLFAIVLDIGILGPLSWSANQVHLSSSGPQSPVLYNCSNITINYNSIKPEDLEVFNNLAAQVQTQQKSINQLNTMLQIQQNDITFLNEQYAILSCELKTRAVETNDTIAQKAAEIMDSDGMRGMTRVADLLQLSYEAAQKNNRPGIGQSEQSGHIARLAYERGIALALSYKINEAKFYYEKAIAIEPENLDYLIAYASTQRELGNSREAYSILKNAEYLAVKAGKGKQGRYYRNVGCILIDLGGFDNAVNCLTKALSIDTIAYGNKHPIVASDYDNLSQALAKKGEFAKAIYFGSQAIMIDTLVFGSKHPDVARAINNLGTVWFDKKEYYKAVDCFNHALSINFLLFNKPHPSIANNYLNLGMAWFQIGDMEKSLQYVSSALAIDTIVYPFKHPHVAQCYTMLGKIWRDRKNYDKTIYCYSRAIEIDTVLYEKNNPEITTSFIYLIWAYRNKAEYSIAAHLCELAIPYAVRCYGIQHKITQDLSMQLQILKIQEREQKRMYHEMKRQMDAQYAD